MSFARGPTSPRRAANWILHVHGEPDEIASAEFVWTAIGPWKRVVATREFCTRESPFRHTAAVLSVIDYAVPADRIDLVGQLDGDLEVDVATGEVRALGPDLAANVLALNLMIDVVTDAMTPHEARRQYMSALLVAQRGTASAMTDVRFAGDGTPRYEPGRLRLVTLRRRIRGGRVWRVGCRRSGMIGVGGTGSGSAGTGAVGSGRIGSGRTGSGEAGFGSLGSGAVGSGMIGVGGTAPGSVTSVGSRDVVRVDQRSGIAGSHRGGHVLGPRTDAGDLETLVPANAPMTGRTAARFRPGRVSATVNSELGALWLLRHGQSLGNVANDAARDRELDRLDLADRDMDVPLSELGNEQAVAFGTWLNAQPDDTRPDVVISSPYVRASRRPDTQSPQPG